MCVDFIGVYRRRFMDANFYQRFSRQNSTLFQGMQWHHNRFTGRFDTFKADTGHFGEFGVGRGAGIVRNGGEKSFVKQAWLTDYNLVG